MSAVTASSNVEPIAVTLPQASALMGCTVRALRELIWAGKLKYVRVGKRFLVSPAELREYFHRNLTCH